MINKLRDRLYLVRGLYELIADLPTGINMVEIGSWIGESTRMFLKSGKIKHIYVVDNWQGLCSGAEPVFDENMVMYSGQFTKLKMTINEAITHIDKKVNFIYIDGDHEYKSVYNDINKSLQILTKGNIIAGHDYGRGYESKTNKAVHELLGMPDKIYRDTSWMKIL